MVPATLRFCSDFQCISGVMTSTIIGFIIQSPVNDSNCHAGATHSLNATCQTRIPWKRSGRRFRTPCSISPLLMRRSAHICPSLRRPISLPLQINRTSYITRPFHNKLFPTTRLAIKHHSSRPSSNMSGTKIPASHGHSEACCNIPPIVAEGYEPKGKYETINGIKTCMN
jgi:hypothetical protein